MPGSFRPRLPRFLVLVYSYNHVPDANRCTNKSPPHHTKSLKSRMRSDSTAVSKSSCACWYLVSSTLSSTAPSGMFMDNTKSTFLLSIRKTANRMWIVWSTAELNLQTSWVPWSTIGEGVSSPSSFGFLVTLSMELDAAELSSAKDEK